MVIKRADHGKVERINPQVNMRNLIGKIVSAKSFELLSVFLFRPGEKLYQSEIVAKSGLSPNTAIPLLKVLTSYGIFTEEDIAGVKFFRMREENPVIKQLKILTNVTNIYDSARDFSNIAEIYLFGSAARGEDSETSDIDLLVLTKGNDYEVNELKNDIKTTLSKKLGREVNPIVYTPSEYSGLFYNKKTLFESIENDKIKIF